jgi:isopenicillin-N epimerase
LERSKTLSPHAYAWALGPNVILLNHGSFGACPRVVLEGQQRLRDAMERNPIGFFMRELEPLLDRSRQALADLVGADARDLVFVRNVTEAVNSVLRSLRFAPGDEILTTDHDYNACRNVVEFVAERAGAKVVVASVPLPIESPEEVVDRVMAAVTDRTRLAVLDHIASPTAVVFPIEELVRQLDGRGVDTLVDGAHAPGMVPLGLDRLGAAYYTGNCHKWLCAPKGAGFLHMRRDRQEGLHPAVISHAYNRPARYEQLADALEALLAGGRFIVSAAARRLRGKTPEQGSRGTGV